MADEPDAPGHSSGRRREPDLMAIAAGCAAAICFIAGAVLIAGGVQAHGRMPADYRILVVLPVCLGVGYLWGIERSWHLMAKLMPVLIAADVAFIIEAVRNSNHLAAMMVVVAPLYFVASALLSYVLRSRLNPRVCRATELSLLGILLLSVLVLSRFHAHAIRLTAVVVAGVGIFQIARRLRWL